MNAFTQVTLLPINSINTINIIDQNQINDVFIHNNNLSTISNALQIQSRNDILAAVSKQLQNLQHILQVYNSTFTFVIKSLGLKLTNLMNNGHHLSSQTIAEDIQKIINIQNKMWTDLNEQKNITDQELNRVKHTLITQRHSQQASSILIKQQNDINNVISSQLNNPMVTQLAHTYNYTVSDDLSQLIHSVNNSSNIHPNKYNILNVNNPFIVNSNHPNTATVTNMNTNTNKVDEDVPKLMVQHSTPTINFNLNCNKTSEKKKRKRRGYNGPYSEEEKKFMKEFDRNQTTEDIIALSIEMENKFKVKRSPYGLAQKMHQMGIINSRLKAVFQVCLSNVPLSRNT